MNGGRDYPLTFEQESLWIAERFAIGPSPYTENWAYRLSGRLDTGALTSALKRIAARHPALRSQFILIGDSVVQRVRPSATLVIEQADWRGKDPDEELRRAAMRLLDIQEAVVRACLFEVAPNDHILLVQCHHIVVDDYSFDVLSAEFKSLYTSAVGGEPAELPAPATSPGEYAADQRARGISASSLDYWARYLDGCEPLRDLPPARRPLPARRSGRGGRVAAAVDGDVALRLRDRARSMRTTPTVALATSLGMAVAGTVGAGDIVIGQAVSRRGPAILDGVFGCFTDVMPLRLRTTQESTFGDLCRSAKRDVIATLSHRDVPWADIAKRLPTTRGALPGSDLIRVVMVVEEGTRLTLPGLECERIYVTPAAVKFDWCVFVVAEGGDYSCYVDYASDNFTPGEAGLALRQWTRTLAEVSANPDLTVADLGRMLASDA